MTEKTKPFAIRPNRRSELKRIVDEARRDGKPISPIIHDLAEQAVKRGKIMTVKEAIKLVTNRQAERAGVPGVFRVFRDEAGDVVVEVLNDA